jgi:hypothetical protein
LRGALKSAANRRFQRSATRHWRRALSPHRPAEGRGLRNTAKGRYAEGK